MLELVGVITLVLAIPCAVAATLQVIDWWKSKQRRKKQGGRKKALSLPPQQPIRPQQ